MDCWMMLLLIAGPILFFLARLLPNDKERARRCSLILDPVNIRLKGGWRSSLNYDTACAITAQITVDSLKPSWQNGRQREAMWVCLTGAFKVIARQLIDLLSQSGKGLIKFSWTSSHLSTRYGHGERWLWARDETNCADGNSAVSVMLNQVLKQNPLFLKNAVGTESESILVRKEICFSLQSHICMRAPVVRCFVWKTRVIQNG